MFIAKNLKKLLKRTNIEFIVFLTAAVILTNGCGKEKSGKNFVARVDNSVLSAQDISKDIDTSGLQPSHKNEYIRNWIETELFYQEAVDEGILKDDDFKRIAEKSKKELAKAFLLKKILESNAIDLKSEESEGFYNLHKEEFRLSHDSYLYNEIVFNDESKAILFRSTLMESDWERATNVFGKDKSILSEKSYIFESDYLLQPNEQYLVLQELEPNEVSIVIDREPNRFVVVQLIKKYRPNEIPEYAAVKKLAAERLQMRKRELLLHEYLKKLYSKHKIELNQGNR